MWRPGRILVGTDFSAGARAATDVAAVIAWRTNASLDLAHVLDPRPVASLVRQGLRGLVPEDDGSRRERAFERLKLTVRTSTWPGHVAHVAHVAHGDPLSELVALRERLGPGLIAIGARAGALHRYLLGSVADGMLRRPGPPLLVVNEPILSGEFKRILVGVELPEQATPWLEIALGLAHDLRAELVLAHVLPPPGYLSDRRHVELAAETVPAKLEALTASLDRSVPIEVRVERGDPAAVLPALAKRTGAELVVIGAERHASGWPGRVAEHAATVRLPALLVAWPQPDERS